MWCVYFYYVLSHKLESIINAEILSDVKLMWLIVKIYPIWENRALYYVNHFLIMFDFYYLLLKKQNCFLFFLSHVEHLWSFEKQLSLLSCFFFLLLLLLKYWGWTFFISKIIHKTHLRSLLNLNITLFKILTNLTVTFLYIFW